MSFAALLAEIWVTLVAALLVGFALGWLWPARRSSTPRPSPADPADAEVTSLRTQIATLARAKDVEFARLEAGALDALERTIARFQERVDGLERRAGEAEDRGRELRRQLDEVTDRAQRLQTALTERDARLAQLSERPPRA